MYIADKIAVRLGLGLEERKIVRIAGLLHDVGHYPLSHVCEFPYKKNLESFPDESFCMQINQKVLSQIKAFGEKENSQYMEQSMGCHHEKIGTFKLDQLIGCMEIGEYEGRKILCISPKGIAAADQYLINKFFSYSQVVFNKHIGITEWMAEQIVNWMQKNSAFFPNKKELEKIVKSAEASVKYVGFTDNFFWASLQNILDNPLKDTEPKIIRFFSEKLLHHSELDYVHGSEVKIVSKDIDEIKKQLFHSDTYKRLANYSTKIAVFNERRMSKQIREEKYEEILGELIGMGNKNPEAEDSVTRDDLAFLKARRYMECITIKEDTKLRLLCDDHRSLMRTLYDVRLVLLRAFDCDVSTV